MKISVSTIVCAAVFLGFAGSVLFIPSAVSLAKEDKEENPEEPYEDFILQRTYPNSTFEINTYRLALNDAAERASDERNSVGLSSVSWQLEMPEILADDSIVLL